MRAPSDMPRRAARHEPGRGRVMLLVAAAVLFAAATSLRGVARFYTDELWFRSLDQSDVFWETLRAKVGLAVAFSLLFGVLLWINLLVAERVAPRNRTFGPGDELLSRYQDMVERRAGAVRLVAAAVFGLIAGVGVSSQWRSWLLFSNAKDFGEKDPQFNLDIGFYVFRLPFLSIVVETVFAATTVVLLITVVAHYLNGGISLNAPVQRVTPAVKAHVSVLLGVLALIKAADYWLAQYELTLSTRGYVDGAGYTSVNAELPVLHLLFVIALLSAGLFIWNIRRRGWALPALAVGLWALVAIVAGAIYPEFVQRFQVVPAQSQREAPYIERNIQATRAALDIDDVRTQEFPYSPELAAEQIDANEATLRNVRLLDPKEVQDTFQQQQARVGFYGFAPLDIDRYPISHGGEDPTSTQVVVGTRELRPNEVPGAPGWEVEHLVYTHGYGAAAAAANTVNSEGLPDYLLRDVPVEQTGAVDVGLTDDNPDARPQIYFGEGAAEDVRAATSDSIFQGYSIVNTQRTEIDYASGENETATTEYRGTGGVGIGTFVRKAAFALRFGDINPLISDLLTSDSRILYNRDVTDRVRTLAPFIAWDSDAYPVVMGGRIIYVVDGYTTTGMYPYAEQADTSDIDSASGLRREPFNYARNSVKAVVDSYDGTVTMYVVDSEDPIIAAWASAFPTLFTPESNIPDQLREHFRYPQDLFRVQTNAYGRYHLTDANQFYEQNNGWSVSQAPPTRVFKAGEVGTRTPNTDPQTGAATGTSSKVPVAPYYAQMSLPEADGTASDDQQFLLVRSFAPVNATNVLAANDAPEVLTAFMAAGSDPGHYGQLTVYTMPAGSSVQGPSQAASLMEGDSTISRQLSLLNVEGTTIRFGDLLLVPIDDSLLYVRPVYLKTDGQPIPRLINVIVSSGNRIVMRPTFERAIEALFPGADISTYETPRTNDDLPTVDDPNADDPDDPSTTTSVPGTSSTPVPVDASVAELLAAADAKLKQADAVLREKGAAGLVEYEQLRAEADALFLQAAERAAELAGEPPPTMETTVPPPSLPPDGETTTTTQASAPA